MTLDARNKIVPQMVDYDRIGEQWVPYIMRTDGSSKSFQHVNTDRWGLRHTIGRNGELLTVDTLVAAMSGDNCSIGAIVGSSAVFGVGSSHDHNTIPSCLNQKTDTSWLNLGGRAYNSTQEVIKLMLHFPMKLDHFVVFSGVNNITLAFISSSTSPVYNSFFSQSTFECAMSNPPGEYVGVRRAWSRLLREIDHRFIGRTVISTRKSIDDSYKDVIECFERDLRVFRALANGVGAKFYFVLQPLATWLDKHLSPEESELFKILDAMPGDWEILAKQIAEVKNEYFADVERITKYMGIPYCNLNLSPEFKTNEWLFVDRVHLTDRGCELASEILKREFVL